MKKPFYLIITLMTAAATALSSLAFAQPPTLQEQNCLGNRQWTTCEELYDVQEFAQKLNAYVRDGSTVESEKDVLRSLYKDRETFEAKKAAIAEVMSEFNHLNVGQYNRALKFEVDAKTAESQANKTSIEHDRAVRNAFTICGAIIGFLVGGGTGKGQAMATAIAFLGGILGYGAGTVKNALKHKAQQRDSANDPKQDPTSNLTPTSTELSLLKR